MDPKLPSRILIVAPVGAYFSRVKNGVRWAVGRTDVSSRKAEVRIIFVLARTWAAEPDYKTDMKHLTEEFSSPELAAQFKQFKVECETIDIDDETSCTVWLVRTLGPFLRSGSDVAAFIDMTSAPKEWIFACHYVAEFFDRICFYYVKSSKPKMPKDFSKEEREDIGAFPETVILSGPDPDLAKWINESTHNWKLFKCICDEIIKEYKKGKRPILDTAVPIGPQSEIAGTWKNIANCSTESDAQRSISKLIYSIEKFGLFVEEVGTIRLSPRGYALGLALGFNLPEEAERQEKP